MTEHNPFHDRERREHKDGDFFREEVRLANRNSGILLESLRHDLTPVGMHYLLNHFDVPYVPGNEWKVSVGGRVRTPHVLSLDELMRLPAKTLRVTMECAIKALEGDLGLALFDRAKRPPVLNAFGRSFVPKAQAVVAAYEALMAERGTAQSVEGELKLGVVPSVITGMMPKALAALRRKYPRLHVELSAGLSADLVERVRAGRLDAAVVSEMTERRSGLVWQPFAAEPLVLIAPPDAPDTEARALVAAYPFIRYSRAAWVGELIDRLIRRERLKVNETMSLDTLEAITAMVHAGLGVSIVPLRASDAEPRPRVRKVTLPGAPVSRAIGLVQAVNRPKAALASALLDELARQAGANADKGKSRPARRRRDADAADRRKANKFRR